MSEAAGSRRSALPWLVAVLVVVALGGVVRLALRGQKREPPAVAIHRVGNEWRPLEGEFAGAGSCRECHQDIYDRQMKTAHAESVRSLAQNVPRSPFGSGQTVVDPVNGARYEMILDGKTPTLSLKLGSKEARQEVQFEFGSGKRAFAYLAELAPNQYLDARLNYYQDIHRWDFTSGQEVPSPTLVDQPLGRPLGADDAAMCFGCHSTVLRGSGVGQERTPPNTVRLNVGKTMLGITCERCHGPRAEHVRAVKSGKLPARPERLSAVGQNTLCGQCHSVPDVTSGHKAVARFQPFGLSQSQCFLKSQGRLSCSSCHDPHEDARRDEAFYVARCLECHSRPSGEPQPFKVRICPVNPRTGCVSCHMARDSKSMLHTTFVDHYIRILKDSEQSRPGSDHGSAKADAGRAIREAFAR